MKSANKITELNHEELLELTSIYAKNWLAHDGCWFLAIEKKLGLDAAMAFDTEAWKSFTVIEARRLIDFLELGKSSGLAGLKKALAFRLYASLNEDDIRPLNNGKLEYVVKTCRVQEARRRKGLPDFPCRPIGLIEYGLFAKTIDERFETESVSCPPEISRPEYYCIWRFSMKTEKV